MVAKGKRKRLVGVVVSDRMQKTITVSVERLVEHPRVKRYVRQYTICKTHDEHQEAREGDIVEIEATRPLSKTKRWRLVRIIKRAQREVKVEPETEQVAGA
jgi:small subunit ribosomal protein S17